MSNLVCTSCKQRKKEENFSQESVQSNAPICAGCDVKSLMKRIEISRNSLSSIKAQQQTVIEVTKDIDTSSKKPVKTTSLSLLKRVLEGRSEGAATPS